MADRNNFSCKLAHSMNRVWRNKHDNWEGCVVTPNGIVAVYSQGGIDETPSTSLDFVWEGRLYSRRIPRRYSRSGLVTIANRYAAEIRGGQAWLD